MSIFLCIDSALGAGSVALYQDNQLLAFESIPEKGAQAKYLIPTIEQCLNSQKLELNKLDRIYCTIGPGGFTGIRIALASTQALGFTLDIPVTGVSTLACMAVEMAASAEKQLTPTIPAAQGKCYTQTFQLPGLKPLEEPALIEIDTPQLSTPIDARSIGKLIQLENFEQYHALPAEPLYIRPPDAKLPNQAFG